VTEYVLYGGKGGVGKTTCAAATGIATAGRGEETLVVSTDPAHSLSDAYGVELSDEPTTVRPGLDATEVEPGDRGGRFRELAETLAEDLRGAGVRVGSEEIDHVFGGGVAPGTDEVAALDLFAEYLQEDRYDRVVFDTAPTGHTLRLLGLPEVMGRALESTMSVREKVKRIGDSAKGMMFGPAYYLARDDDDADEFAALKARFEAAGEALRDPERTEFRVVTLPERMVVAETERLVEQLRDQEIPVGALAINRVIGECEADCRRCRAAGKRQRTAIDELHDRFPDLPIREVPDLVGRADDPDSLETIAEHVDPGD